MRIGVFSDTHHDLSLAQKVLEEQGTLDLLLHAGDHYQDALALGEKFKIKTKGVAGNCDFFSSGPTEEIIKLGKNTILLTHGHKYGVKKGLQSLYYRSQEVGANIVVFGHTHIPLYIVENNIHFLNPGSLTLPRGVSTPSFALITLDTEVSVDLVEFAKK